MEKLLEAVSSRKVAAGVAFLLLAPLAAIGLSILAAHAWMLDADAEIAIEPAAVSADKTAFDLVTDETVDYIPHVCCDYSLATIETIEGQPARLFRVRPTDPLVKGNYRAELRLRPNEIGQDVWYRGRIFVPENWQPSPINVIAMQWHGTRDVFMFEPGRPAPLQLSIIDDRWEITKAWDQRFLTSVAGDDPGTSAGREVIGSAALTKGRWLDWVFHVHWATDDSGRVRVWSNGELIVDDHGPNTHHDLIGPYMKAGVYVPEWLIDGPEADMRERSLYLGGLQLAGGIDPFGMNEAGAADLRSLAGR